MEKQPWDLPRTAEGREALIALGQQYENEGKTREFAWTILRLSQTLKQVGSGQEDVDWRAWSLGLSRTALQVFREIDDKFGIAEALRSSVPIFAPKDVRVPIIQQALAISTEIGDLKGEGWAHFALGNGPDGDPEAAERAFACFEAADEKRGMAAALRRKGVNSRNGSEFLQAADLYLESGDPKEAYRSLVMAALFGRHELSDDEREQILLRALRLTQEHKWPSDQHLVLKNLADLMKAAKRFPERKHYLAEARKLKQFSPKFDV